MSCDREKLIDLINEIQDSGKVTVCSENSIGVYSPTNERLADHLIANGVTVQQWISVEDRVPEQYKSVIVWTRYGEMGEAQHDGKHFAWAYDDDYALATHWMPMPTPPKED